MGSPLSPTIEAIWLYGSFARRNQSPDSDLDLLVLTSEPDEEISDTALVDAFCLPRVPDISRYTRVGIQTIIDPPSLFAWHLHLEGRPLLDRTLWLTRKLQTVGPFTFHQKELDILIELQQDIRGSVEQDTASLVFDAAALATVARNAALLLSDACGQPDFSPFSPLPLRTHPVIPFPLAETDYLLLRQCRLSVERGMDAPAISQRKLLDLLDTLAAWLLSLREHLPRGL